MKKKIIFFSITLFLLPFVLKAQTIESEAYVTNNQYASHSQIIHNRKDISIVLSRLTTGAYRFQYINNGVLGASPYVDFPINLIIKDFKILGDTVYFCGVNTSSGNSGFISYVNIYDLFHATTLNNHLGRISYIPYVTDIRKLVAYYHDNVPGRVKVCAIGEIDESYVQPPHSYDCLIELFVDLPNSYSPPYNFYNVYRCPHNSNTDELYDIELTNNVLCLISVNVSYTVNGYCPKYFIRTFDKFNLTNRKTNEINTIELPTIGTLDYNVLLEPLNGDTISLTYAAAYYPLSTQEFVNVVHKMYIENLRIIPIKTSTFDNHPEIHNINDVKFDKSLNKLLILKENKLGAGYKEDALCYIDMSNITTIPNNATCINIPPNAINANSVSFYGLSELYNNYYRLAGKDDNGSLIIFNKLFNYFNPQSSCNIISVYSVKPFSLPVNIISNNWDMVYTMPPMSPGISYLHDLSIPIYNVSNTQMECQSY